LSDGQSSDRYWISTERAFGKTSQLVGTSLRQCGVAKRSAKNTSPFRSHTMSVPRCHQRASPIEWRMPGSPTCPGSVIESCFAVQSGSSGTGFWMRNQSLPGVE
jgi:hypothetical protein